MNGKPSTLDLKKMLVVTDEKRKFNNELSNFQREVIHSLMWNSCINCGNFNKQLEKCNKFNARPPAEIIVVGCGEYIIDVVPL